MVDANILSLVIANRWDEWAPMLGEARERFECQLTILLRRVDQAHGPDQTAAVEAILQLFRQFSAVYAKLVAAMRESGVQQHKGGAVGAIFVRKDRHEVVPVFYATNRAASAAPGAPICYGGERGDLAYGMAQVTIPDDHRMGEIERPQIWKLQFREDPDQHVVVLGIEQMPLAAFTARAISTLDRCSKREVLLFVHGYNVGFAEAVSRTAQIAYDLHFVGLPALFSWPSEASAPKYTVDETNVAWSRPQFEQFLKVLRDQLGAETVHIIAHSMGTRLVAETIAAMAHTQAASSSRLRQIVLAAPDIDADTFKNFAKSFPEKAERFTLYASSVDKALAVSKVIHKYARAGDSGVDLVVLDSVDTVDASAVDTSLMGHSYYGEIRSVLTDLFLLIRNGTPPQDRHLKENHLYGKRYWVFGR